MTTEEKTPPPVTEPTTEHDLAAKNIMKNHVIAAGGVALVPIPIFIWLPNSHTNEFVAQPKRTL